MQIHRFVAIAFVSLLSISFVSGQESGQRGNQDLPTKVIPKPRSTQKEVSFQTRDGWKISGTFTVPASHDGRTKMAAALLLHSPLHTQIIWGVYPGWLKVQEAIVTLRIDLRGRGKSEGPIAYTDFKLQRENIALDIRAGLDFLGAQPEVDASRLGVVAEGYTADAAVAAATDDPRVQVFVLISGLLSQKTIDLVAAGSNKPTLLIVSKEDKPSFAAMSKVYSSATHPKSDIWVLDGLGTGLAMGSVWRNRNPETPEEQAIDFQAGEWLVRQLRSLGTFSEIKLQTADGWTLYANLGLPGSINDGQLVPGVILLPTALSDRTSFHNLERLLVGNDIAVLNLDWRSIGKSINKGTLIEQSATIFAEALNDVEVAYRFLSSYKGVDPKRIGILGGAVGAKLTMSVTKQSNKVKAIALLSPITKPEELASDQETVSLIKQPILLVTSDGLGKSTKKLAEYIAQGKHNTVKTYPGGHLGYALFSVDRRLEQTIADWFKLQLAVP